MMLLNSFYYISDKKPPPPPPHTMDVDELGAALDEIIKYDVRNMLLPH
jgi:hypothetical protein